ncbi:RNA-binding protein [Candidatus Woesearchaeota archaeon]|nr:RNA-binding protein [Candidatus Woesearchaeota archaeon]MBT5342557.1 RNA-binding protein [Candidatus Woesearchaeota archaeon]
MEEKHCTSCKKKVANDPGNVIFACPSCGKYEVVRCSRCRVDAVTFKCPSCGFEGPN